MLAEAEVDAVKFIDSATVGWMEVGRYFLNRVNMFKSSDIKASVQHL